MRHGFAEKQTAIRQWRKRVLFAAGIAFFAGLSTTAFASRGMAESPDRLLSGAFEEGAESAAGETQPVDSPGQETMMEREIAPPVSEEALRLVLEESESVIPEGEILPPAPSAETYNEEIKALMEEQRNATIEFLNQLQARGRELREELGTVTNEKKRKTLVRNYEKKQLAMIEAFKEQDEKLKRKIARVREAESDRGGLRDTTVPDLTRPAD